MTLRERCEQLWNLLRVEGEGSIDDIEVFARALAVGTWTTEKPTTPGWYWWSRKGRPLVCSVYRDEYDKMLYVMFPEDSVRRVADQDGQWAGPIAEPEEQP